MWTIGKKTKMATKATINPIVLTTKASPSPFLDCEIEIVAAKSSATAHSPAPAPMPGWPSAIISSVSTASKTRGPARTMIRPCNAMKANPAKAVPSVSRARFTGSSTANCTKIAPRSAMPAGASHHWPAKALKSPVLATPSAIHPKSRSPSFVMCQGSSAKPASPMASQIRTVFFIFFPCG